MYLKGREQSSNFIKRIPVIIRKVKPRDALGRSEEFSRADFPSQFGGAYSGPQSQPIEPGQIGYGGQTGINTDLKPSDLGMVPGGI